MTSSFFVGIQLQRRPVWTLINITADILGSMDGRADLDVDVSLVPLLQVRIVGDDPTVADLDRAPIIHVADKG